MTLGEFLTYLNNNPLYVVVYLILIPFAAWLAGVMSKDEGHRSPWKYIYAVLIYLVCIPGIFALTLNVYLFLFERRSIFDLQVNTQILPVFSMIATLLIIRKDVDLDLIPGFHRISGLIMMIAAAICIMWFVDKVRIIIFSYMPIQSLLLIFVGLLIVIRLGWYWMFQKKSG
jgi:hypothetical protein